MISMNGWVRPTGKFPNGETWIDIGCQFETKHMNRIEVKFESNDDLINLMCLKRHCDSMRLKCCLIIKNFPYGRMDRFNKDYPFSLKYIAEFINNLNFEYVNVSEPHSDVTNALVDRIVVDHTIWKYLETVSGALEMNIKEDFIFFPDAGAQKRYGNIAEFGFEIATGNKLRDFKSGDIISYEINYNKNLPTKDKKVLIVDDLCCGGRTFIEAAKKIREQFETENIFLFVAHCEPAIFNGEILTTDLIKKVFTTCSIPRNTHEKIVEVEKLKEGNYI